MRWLALLALLFIGTETSSASDLCMLLQPCKAPARYASGAYIAKPEVREVSMQTVSQYCNDTHVAAGAGALGCATIEGGTCLVLVPKEVRAISPQLFKLIVEHELAHCRGWVH